MVHTPIPLGLDFETKREWWWEAWTSVEQIVPAPYAMNCDCLWLWTLLRASLFGPLKKVNMKRTCICIPFLTNNSIVVHASVSENVFGLKAKRKQVVKSLFYLVPCVHPTNYLSVGPCHFEIFKAWDKPTCTFCPAKSTELVNYGLKCSPANKVWGLKLECTSPLTPYSQWIVQLGVF